MSDTPNNFKSVPYSHDDFGARLFESITMGLYAHPLHAIREYIQNEIDPYPKPTMVSIRLDGNNLTIFGTGKGMDEVDIETAKKVGISDKNPSDFAGFRGIGIWSGVAIADEIYIKTKKAKSPKIFYLKVNAKGIRRDFRSNISMKALLENNVELAHSKDLHSREQLFEHYTQVELRDIISQVRERTDWTDDGIREYLSDVIPVDFHPEWPFRERISKELQENVPDYRVYSIDFQGKPIFRPPYTSLRLDPPKMNLLFNDKGKRIGFYWFAMNAERKKIEDEDYPRLVFKKQGFTIGDRRSVVPLFHEGEHLLSECTGEIHVVDRDVIPDSERMGFESSLEKEGLWSSIASKLAKFLEEEVRKRSYRGNLAEAITRIDELSMKPRAQTIQEKVQVLKELDKIEGRLSERAYRREWTPESLQAQRVARLPTIRKLRTKFGAQRPAITGSPQLISESKASMELEQPEDETPLIEMVENLHLRSQSRMIIGIVESIISDLVPEADLRKRIRRSILEELSQVVKVK